MYSAIISIFRLFNFFSMPVGFDSFFVSWRKLLCCFCFVQRLKKEEKKEEEKKTEEPAHFPSVFFVISLLDCRDVMSKRGEVCRRENCAGTLPIGSWWWRWEAIWLSVSFMMYTSFVFHLIIIKRWLSIDISFVAMTTNLCTLSFP